MRRENRFLKNRCLENRCLENRCLENRCLENRFLENRCLENRCLENRCLENRCLENRFLENRCLENRCLENRFLENRCLENRCLENRCLENRCLENRCRERIDAKRIDAVWVAGAIFGEVAGWRFVAGAAFRDILGGSRSAKCCFFIQNASPRWDESGLRSGGCEITILSLNYPRISSDYPRTVLESSLYWRKQLRDFSPKSWTQNFVAGAVLGEFEGWLYLLRSL